MRCLLAIAIGVGWLIAAYTPGSWFSDAYVWLFAYTIVALIVLGTGYLLFRLMRAALR